MFHSVCFSLLTSLHTQHNFYISLLLPSHGEEQVAREGGVMVRSVSHPGILPQLQVDHIPHLQQKRSPIGGCHVNGVLGSVGNANMLSVFMERDCRSSSIAIRKHKDIKVVDPSDWSCEDP